MYSVRRGYLIAGMLTAILFCSQPVYAQYTADFQTNIISGVTSNWTGNYYVGSNTFADVLLIQNSGVLNCYIGVLGKVAPSGDNTAIITGTGSIWKCTSNINISYRPGNSLIISNGGKVISPFGCWVGSEASSSNNSVVATGAGTVWDCGPPTPSYYPGLEVGLRGSGNSLLIADGAKVNSTHGTVGEETAVSNAVAVTGTGSVWLIYNSMSIGTGSKLLIRNGGQVKVVSNTFLGANNAVLVADPGSSWNNSSALYLGGEANDNSLVISNGALVSSGSISYIGAGFNSPSDANSVLVTDSGSVWSNNTELYVGFEGSNNRLVVSNGARVIVNSGVHLGDFNDFGQLSNTNNSMVVTGLGSNLSTPDQLYVGVSGSSDNSLLISNGGKAVNNLSVIGVSSSSGYITYHSSRNRARVADGGMWTMNRLELGRDGISNSLVIAGGAVSATNVTVGLGYADCSQLVQLDSGNLAVTNPAGTAVFEVRGGKLLLNGGTLLVDRFVMTNACAQFVRTGGTLIYGTAILDPTRDDDGDGLPNGWEQLHGLDPLNAADANVDSDGDGMSNLQEYLAGTDPQDSASAFRIVGIAPEGNDLRVTWMMGSGKTNALQAADGDNGYSTNGFTDIFIVTNTMGSVTNYLDSGAATNGPGRFYRVRLVP